ncbi:hypothetical protein [Stratiformator vulcanicus]|nr:hypothetical protein [Stratiformator vulcanicus]
MASSQRPLGVAYDINYWVIEQLGRLYPYLVLGGIYALSTVHFVDRPKSVVRVDFFGLPLLVLWVRALFELLVVPVFSH